MSESFTQVISVQEGLAVLPEVKKMALGHQIGDLIVECQYAGVTCYPSWYVAPLDTVFIAIIT